MLPARHRLARSKRVTPVRWPDERFVALHEMHCLADQSARFCLNRELQPPVVMHGSNLSRCRRWCGGDGRFARARHDGRERHMRGPRLRLQPIRRQAHPPADAALAAASNRTLAARAFAAMASEMFGRRAVRGGGLNIQIRLCPRKTVVNMISDVRYRYGLPKQSTRLVRTRSAILGTLLRWGSVPAHCGEDVPPACAGGCCITTWRARHTRLEKLWNSCHIGVQMPSPARRTTRLGPRRCQMRPPTPPAATAHQNNAPADQITASATPRRTIKTP